ncbi:MAG: hypothetical protein P0S96_02690 [Simkaniaceae bacterium]|nr:hypothetical protein [Candidatus Sacchlamyda saccharinae]
MSNTQAVQPGQPVVIKIQSQESQGSWAGTAFRIAVVGAAVFAAWQLGFAQGADAASREAGVAYEEIMSRLASMTTDLREQAFASFNATMTRLPTISDGGNSSFMANFTQYVPTSVMEFFTGAAQTPAGQFAEQVRNQTGTAMPKVEMPGSETLTDIAAKADDALFYLKGAFIYYAANKVLSSPVAHVTGKAASTLASVVSPLARRLAGR